MNNNYDRVAGFYDGLSRLVFGDALMQAQRSVLPYIPARARILMVGGGTGAILEEITRLQPGWMDITYVEISAKMIAIARKRNVGRNNVVFVNAPIESFKSDEQFDVIITAFLFDNFKQDKAEISFQLLDKMLAKDGVWLFTDFNVEQNPAKFWQKWLLKSMYIFFKILSHVEANKLPKMADLFKNAGYKAVSQQAFYAGFVQSFVYKKQ